LHLWPAAVASPSFSIVHVLSNLIKRIYDSNGRRRGNNSIGRRQSIIVLIAQSMRRDEVSTRMRAGRVHTVAEAEERGTRCQWRKRVTPPRSGTSALRSPTTAGRRTRARYVTIPLGRHGHVLLRRRPGGHARVLPPPDSNAEQRRSSCAIAQDQIAAGRVQATPWRHWELQSFRLTANKFGLILYARTIL
jgi:hypothetical protein